MVTITRFSVGDSLWRNCFQGTSAFASGEDLYYAFTDDKFNAIAANGDDGSPRVWVWEEEDHSECCLECTSEEQAVEVFNKIAGRLEENGLVASLVAAGWVEL